MVIIVALVIIVLPISPVSQVIVRSVEPRSAGPREVKLVRELFKLT